MKGIIKGAGTVIAAVGVATAGVAVDKISGAHVAVENLKRLF